MFRRPRLPWSSGFILAAAICDGCGIANYLTCVLWLDNDRHATPDLIGLLASVSTIAYVASVVLIGSVADRVGSRRMTSAGALLMAVGNTIIMLPRWAPFSHHWIACLVVGMLAKGFAAAIFWPALASWLGKGAPPHLLPRRLAAYNLGWCGGQVIGLAAAGMLYELIGGLPSFGVYACLYLLLAVGVWWLPEARAAAEGDEPVELVTSSREQRLAAWVTNFGGFFVLATVRAMFPTYGRTQLGLDPREVSLCVALATAVQLAMFYFLGVARPRLASGALLRPAQWLAAGTLFLMAATGAPGAMLALPAVGLLVGAANTASLYHSLSGRDDAARQSGIHETMLGSASILGPVLGGLAARRGATGPWWLCCGVALAALAASRAVQRRRHLP